jgi:isochorismate pyruvate lyase
LSFDFVKAAAKFKISEASVRALERFEAMLSAPREWAQEAGLSPDVIESIYCQLVGYFVREELEQWKRKS